jgi:hypothetical protein
MTGSAKGFARETTFIENVALQGNPFASQVGHAAPDSSEAIHTQEAKKLQRSVGLLSKRPLLAV